MHSKSMARQMLNTMDFEPIREKYSAEYAFDFFEESSQFGSQLNLKVIAGEFDDMPSFVYGKSVYYLKSAAYQPFSVRQTNVFSIRMLEYQPGLTLGQQLTEGGILSIPNRIPEKLALGPRTLDIPTSTIGIP